MVDKIRPLKLESPALGGTEDDDFPTAADPNEDYVAAKGMAFEDDDNTRIEKAADGNVQIVSGPAGTLKIESPVPLIIALG